MGASSSSNCLLCDNKGRKKEDELRCPALKEGPSTIYEHAATARTTDNEPEPIHLQIVDITDDNANVPKLTQKPNDITCTTAVQETTEVKSPPTEVNDITCTTTVLEKTEVKSPPTEVKSPPFSKSPPCSGSTTCTDASNQGNMSLNVEDAFPLDEVEDSARPPDTGNQKQLQATAPPKKTGNSLGGRFSKQVQKSSTRLGMKLKNARTKSWKKGSTMNLNPPGAGATRIKCKPSNNSNKPGDYIWLQEVLMIIVKNEAHSLGVVDTASGKGFVPIFFVLGSCPNTFCAMQAVMYSVSREGDQDLDFWWVKPQKAAATKLERNTLSRNFKGPHKNDPGRSKPFYKAFADLFGQDSASPPGMQFGIEKVKSNSSAQQATPRAYLRQDSDGSKMYLHIVWQEDWTTNPFARKQFIKGKIVYQKDPEGSEFFSRQYCIQNGSVLISEVEEPPFQTMLPGDDIKDLWEGVA